MQSKGEEVLEAILGNTKSGSVPPAWLSPQFALSLASGHLRGEGNQLQASALGTELGYSLPLSMVFMLCIIYGHEVSVQVRHHTTGHRDP